MKKYILIMLCASFLYEVSYTQGVVTITIQDVIASNKFKVEFNGIEQYDSSQIFQDYSNVYYGKSIELSLINFDTVNYIVTGGIGMFLSCRDSSIQDMLITKDFYCAIRPKQTIRTKIYAMCMEYHDDMPNVQVGYTLKMLENRELIKLASYISNNELQNIIGQSAVWMKTDSADYSMLQKYGVTPQIYDSAKAILAEIDSNQTSDYGLAEDGNEHFSSAKNSSIALLVSVLLNVLLLFWIYLNKNKRLKV